MTVLAVVEYCVACKRDVVPSRAGCCSWCDAQLDEIPAAPVVADELQRALEATVLFHLTEPRAHD